MKLKNIFLTICLFSVVACSEPEYAGVDYHVHIQSQEMAKAMEKLCGTFVRCPEGIVHPSNAKDVEVFLDSTVFTNAVILSSAYMTGMPEFELDIKTQKKLTRSENEFVAHQVSNSKKLFGFFSVSPLAEYALEEANYWIKTEKFHGIKLHLANADFDFFNSEHVEKLQKILELIDKPSMNIMLHGRTRNPEFGQKDVEVLINEIIPYAPQSTWILAHAAGWGGYDEPTDIALATVIDAMNSGKLDKSKVFLDISAVVVPEAIKKYYPIPKDTLDLQTMNFISRFHKLDINNWVFGSDWTPKENNLKPYYYLNELIAAGFNEQELKKVISNKLDFIQ